ncbi:hypothetical protein EVA_14077 [gut metagenome]|uniref:Uncharacterized protein n=1 Tax=gut metagenome TaxID=749906 RepID=J9CCW1_9ZZZZ
MLKVVGARHPTKHSRLRFVTAIEYQPENTTHSTHYLET